MNKIVKRVLIVIGTVLIIFLMIMVGFYFKFKSEISQMHVTETKEVTHNVYAIKDSFVNMFLVKDSDNYIAIDAGNDTTVIATELKKLNINADKVVAVLLTHGDGDHTASLPLFRNAKVYLSRQEEQMINGKTAKLMFFHNKLSTNNYILLDDQQTLKIGNITIRGIETPGHTPGSMSYLVNNQYLFVGDAFGLNNGKIDKPNKFFSGDMETAIKSFDNISDLSDVEYIFTAHNGYSDNYKNAVSAKLK